MVFIDVTTKQLLHSTKTTPSSVSTVTFLRFPTSASTETSPKYIATKRDRKLTSVAYSYTKMVSKLATWTPTSVHLITWGRQSDPSATMTTSSPNYISTSMFVTPSNSDGLTSERTFLDDQSKLVLLTSVCGGVAGLSVLVVLVVFTYKHACGDFASSALYVPFPYLCIDSMLKNRNTTCLILTYIIYFRLYTFVFSQQGIQIVLYHFFVVGCVLQSSGGVLQISFCLIFSGRESDTHYSRLHHILKYLPPPPPQKK